jgi:hypothetical protein
MRRKPTKKGCKIDGNQVAIFGGISRPKCTLLGPKIEKCKFKGQIK